MNRNSVSIIIQGPTNFYKDVLVVYKGLSNVVWSTWEDEPAENISAIQEAGILVVLSKKPVNCGNWNVNLQVKSTYVGLLKSREIFNTEYYIKIRSDFRIYQINLLLDRFIEKGERLNFLGWANMLDGFILDYIVFGNYESMKDFWRFDDISTNGYPCPEIFLMNRYFVGINPVELKSELLPRLPLLDGIKFQWLSKKVELRDFSKALILNFRDKKFYYFIRFKLKALSLRYNSFLNYLLK